MDERLRRRGHVKKGVARGRHLAQALADHQQHVGVAHARGESGIDADSHVPGIVRVAIVEEILAAKRASHRQFGAFREAPQRGAGVGVPAAAAGDDQRSRGVRKQGARGRDLAGIGGRDDRIDARRVRAYGARSEHVLGKRQHDRTRAAGHRDAIRMRQVFRNALRAIDLGNPFGDAAVHLAIVDFLERFAVDHVAADLAHEDDHRRRILRGRVNADSRVGGARAAGHERKSRAAGQLAAGLRHVRGATLLPANDEAESVAGVVHRVEDGQVTLAGNAERQVAPCASRPATRISPPVREVMAGVGTCAGQSSADQILRDARRRLSYNRRQRVLAHPHAYLRHPARRIAVRRDRPHVRHHHDAAGAAAAQGHGGHGRADGAGPGGDLAARPVRRRYGQPDTGDDAARSRAARRHVRAGPHRRHLPVRGAAGARGGAANDGRCAARRHAARLRHLPDERDRRESGQPHHDVRGVDRRHRVFDAGDAGQPVGRHRAAGRQHLPARRLDTRRRRGRADHRHPLALSGRRDQ